MTDQELNKMRKDLDDAKNSIFAQGTMIAGLKNQISSLTTKLIQTERKLRTEINNTGR